ncbi:MAG: hypothetical protein M3R25_01530 [Bacteroidota bacterium]|nr:hypothetical protein [Bacteroidota bacterium]
MSQKKRKPTAPQHQSPASTTMPSKKSKVLSPVSELIHFDKKVWIYIGICIFLFFLFVALKWHNASIGNWNLFANDGGDPSRGIIAGTPRPIRSDEWQVYSSFILSQAAQDFPISNMALGAGNTPLTFNLPTHHIVSAIKPALWGYYFIDLERAYSWHWNFKLFPFLIVSFLFLMLLTKNHFVLSVTGSIWLFLSSAIQWWSIYTELFTWGMLSVIALIYILYADRSLKILLASIVLILSAYSYAMILYPAYQVPFAYFLLAILIGYLLAYKVRLVDSFRQNMMLRIGSLALVFAGVGLFIFLFYQETKDTISLLTNTVYPGKRSETGGDFSFAKMFADNFSWFMNEQKFPEVWGNICELSSFLMLSLIPTLILIADFFKKRKIDPVLLTLMILQFILFIYIVIGFPPFLAKITLFSVSPSNRTFFIFGFINVIFTILFITRHQIVILKNNRITQIASLIILVLLAYLLNSLLNHQISIYFSEVKVITATLIFASLTWLTLQFHRDRLYSYSFIVLILLVVLPNIRVNPLSIGLAPYFENETYKAISEIRAKDPNAGWAVFGSIITANFVKATGVNCFNGVQFVPPFEKLHILDSGMKSDSVYNRFAHIGLTTMIDGNDSVEFELKQNDMYMIRMDPCSPKLTQLGIKYIVFTYQPQEVEVECMTGIIGLPGHVIYQRNDL